MNLYDQNSSLCDENKELKDHLRQSSRRLDDMKIKDLNRRFAPLDSKHITEHELFIELDKKHTALQEDFRRAVKKNNDLEFELKLAERKLRTAQTGRSPKRFGRTNPDPSLQRVSGKIEKVLKF